MSGQADSDPAKRDYTLATMKILVELAEKGQLFPMFDFMAYVAGEEPDGKLGRPCRDRKRWPAFEARCRSRIRNMRDVATLLWGGALVLAWCRATEGGRRATIYLRHGRKPPDRRVTRAVADLLRQSGLQAYVRRHAEDGSVLSVRF
ncbi:hypothetical protein AMJ57_00675 [Parcubacteria bacterium SG8_24]|nr:MAG: hypothetical protein AMJ57_00675 [Parcubacteria bacterium SG8_24]